MTNKHYRKKPSKTEIRETLKMMVQNNPEKAEALKKLIDKFDCFAYQEETYEFYDKKELTEIINQKQKQMKTPVSNNNDYNTIVNGRIAVYCKEKTETSKTITSKKTGVSREYELYKDVCGKLKSVYVYEKDIDTISVPFLVITLTDKQNGKEVSHVIETSFKGAYAKNFLMRLPNVDKSKPVVLIPYNVKDEKKSEEKGKDVYNTGLKITQSGETIKTYFTKENPNGLPPALEIKVKGKTTGWNFDEQEEFLKELVIQQNFEIKKFEKLSPVENTTGFTEDETDDLF